MREILFRGRNKHSREWEFGCYYKQTEFYGDEIEDHVIITSHEELSYDQALVCYSVQPETVGQFTGLTDKNGTKIFEGDIVELKDFSRGVALNYKQPTSRWVVKWYAETAKFGIDYMQLLPYDFKKSEVIGNIHDNPELLKGGV